MWQQYCYEGIWPKFLIEVAMFLDGLCEKDWELHGQSWYLLCNSSYLDFTQAKAACTEKEAMLVSVSGEEEQNFLRDL